MCGGIGLTVLDVDVDVYRSDTEVRLLQAMYKEDTDVGCVHDTEWLIKRHRRIGCICCGYSVSSGRIGLMV